VRIENVETFIAHNWMFVRITTDNGLQGVGESTFFSHPDAAAAIATSFGEQLIGEDPLRTEFHWLRLYRAGSMRGMAITGAISAIDQALWDIRGKHFQAPVWQLLGGKVRDKVRAMFVLEYGTPDEVIASAKAAVADGYTALKCLLFQKEHHRMRHGARLGDLVARLAALREAMLRWSSTPMSISQPTGARRGHRADPRDRAFPSALRRGPDRAGQRARLR